MNNNFRFTKLIILMLILVLCVALINNFPTYIMSSSNDLLVHFIDVGQGDAILIQGADRETILIDGGDRYQWSIDKLLGYLETQGVHGIDAIISTHPHADHIGGLESVIRAFPVKAVYDSGKVHGTLTYESYLEVIYEKEIPFYTPRRGDTIEIGQLTLDILHPADDVEIYSVNNASIVARLQYGEISFLFTGDAEYEVEDEMLLSGFNLPSTILKVGHHGSRTSTHSSFLDSVNPEVAVITVGSDNRYGHPHSQTVEAIDSRDIDLYRTDKHGTVIVYTDGNSYYIEAEKDIEPRAPPVEDVADKININTASYEELQQITGVGPAIAERIIEYRNTHGLFVKIEDIVNVWGISDARFDQMKNEITVGD